jgi:hypothetical protein
MPQTACQNAHGFLGRRDTIGLFYQGILKGKYHCTVDLLFDWFGISCMTTENFCFYLQNRLIDTSQTGGQWNNDTSPFSIPCFYWLFLKAKAQPQPLATVYNKDLFYQF